MARYEFDTRATQTPLARTVGRSFRPFNDTRLSVWAWEDAPEMIKELCNRNGGDEDWVVVAHKEFDYLPLWLMKMDAGDDPDVYILDGLVIYVGSHA